MKSLLTTIIRWISLMTLVIGSVAATADAQDATELERARAQLAMEPSVAETVRTSLEYFRVDPDTFDSLRARANSRAALPLFAAGYRFDDHAFTRFEEQRPTPVLTDEDRSTVTHEVTIGGVWDLREAVFNPAEIQVYGLIGVQRDIMLEVTRTYYLRRQLLLRLLLRPPEEPLARAALELRVEEFTAILDVLTDGWFSEEAEARRENGGRPSVEEED